MQVIYETPSPKLNELWREWIELRESLSKSQSVLLAAPFLSAASRLRDKCSRRVMFVGKATDKCWQLDGYKTALSQSVDVAIHDRLTRNRQFMQEGGLGSGFWMLMKRFVNEYCPNGWDGIVWSNVVKIGTLKDMPKGDLLSAQASLAERTLRAEIEEYKPTLVVFVTHRYADQIIKRALDLTDNDWHSSTSADVDDNVWWRKGSPALLWTEHPGRKSNQVTDFWFEKAQALIGN